MQRFARDLDLSPRWWWATVAAVVVVALIFLASGSPAAALVCLVSAVAIAALAWTSGAARGV